MFQDHSFDQVFAVFRKVATANVVLRFLYVNKWQSRDSILNYFREMLTSALWNYGGFAYDIE